MALFLTILSGVAWTAVYICAILVGFRDKSYAIPAAALGLNIAWESIYAIHSLSTRISVQGIINIAWALADVVIVCTFLRFGRRELPGFITRPLFIGWAVLLLLASFAVQWLFIVEFDWDPASRYAAFLQNLLMSGLFIAMFAARRGLRGQSMLIAVAKWIGTLAPTITFGVLENSPFILGIGILCSVFDLTYIGLLLWAKRNPLALSLS
ncbi:hypothetical protein GCM10023063_47000 [Arthrobacter methylotrophus]|uniref:Uncharacterized protein n=1 Tax=Arthrobacter methylotrophus TaxID=121291 RepID=A0ABV5UVG1_9MICC